MKKVQRGRQNLVGLLIGLLIAQVAVGQDAAFSPPYPRIVAHKMGGWSTVDDAQMRIIARHHVADLGTWRKWSASGYNSATLSTYLKSLNPSIKLLHSSSIVQNGNSTDPNASDYPIKMKTESQKGKNGNGDWWLRTANGANITGFNSNLWRANFTETVTPDANGRRLPEWYFLFLYSRNSDGIDYVSQGTGLREGSWDGLYEDDQYISYGPMGISNADYDEDGAADNAWDSDVRTWVMRGHIAFRDAMKAKEPKWLFVANMAGRLNPSETVPTSFQKINDGGFFERHSRIEYTQGWQEMMNRYRLGLSWLTGPKIGMLHNDLNTLRTNYPASGFTDFRWNRYMLCSTLLDNGYYVVSDTTYQKVLWFDEHWGGSLQKVGYLGYPIDPPQTSAWSQGVYRREFDNGLVLVNPKGNGRKTIEVGTGWKRLLGQQDPIHNDGKPVTSLTLSEQDGIILLRGEAKAPPEPPELQIVE